MISKLQLKGALLLIICLFIPAVLWLYVIFHPDSSYYGYGGADNVLHYQIARYAFQHPELFFYHWGKPVFTMLSSPFAQFGFHGINFFNMLASLLTCFFAWRTAKNLELPFPSLVVIFTAFSPAFFFSATSSLTEPLFALFASLSVMLFALRKYIFSAIVFSFTIFIRSESIVLFPVFLTALIFVRQWKAIPFLLTGFIAISLAGYPIHKELFWFFTKMPYSMGQSIYGSGSIFHFIRNFKEVFGLPLFIFLIIGCISLLRNIFVNKTFRENENLAKYILIAGIPFIFLAAHSWVWYKGTGGSLGLLRVMACVSPFFALAGLEGFYFLSRVSSRLYRQTKAILYIVAVISCVIFLFSFHPGLIFKPEDSEKMIEQTVRFLQKEGLENQKIFFFNPSVSIYLDKDPWSENMKSMTGGLDELKLLKPGDIYVWDAHLGPNEGKTPLDTLLSKTDLELIMMMLPNKLYDETGNLKFAVYTFRKSEPGKITDNHALADNPEYFINKLYSFAKLIYATDDTGILNISDPVFTSDSAENCNADYLCFTERPEFYNLIDTSFFELSGGKEEITIFFECEVMIPAVDGLHCYVVFSTEKENHLLYYEAVPFRFTHMNPNTWEEVFAMVHVRNKYRKSTRLNCYIWNRGQAGSMFCVRKIRITEMIPI